MWVEKLDSGKYKYIERYEDYLTGEMRRVSVTLEKNTASARKQAQTALAAKIEKALARDVTVKKDITLRELVAEYRKSQKLTVKESTYSRNYHACNTLMKMLGENVLVDRLTARYVRDSFLSSGKENSTLNEHLTRFKALIRWGYKNDLLRDISYLDKIERFKDVPHREKIQDKFLESAEANLLLDNMAVDKWRNLAKFLILSGLRFGEAAALNISDLDLKERVIRVNKTYDVNNGVTTTPKTFSSIRKVYIQDEMLDLCRIIRYDALCQRIVTGCDLLFQDDGKHISYFAFNKYLKENSVKYIERSITPHVLRHPYVKSTTKKYLFFLVPTIQLS
ncbi:MAG TPA: tyrosine-type recombinase/integrase [Candidatus Anaerobutyricum faecale]|nr:tyrosine-type recombinase/integrase [Candidatus Anaerobutyricum faecale]